MTWDNADDGFSYINGTTEIYSEAKRDFSFNKCTHKFEDQNDGAKRELCKE